MNLQRCYVVETYPLTTVLGTGALFSSRWIPFLPIVGRGEQLWRSSKQEEHRPTAKRFQRCTAPDKSQAGFLTKRDTQLSLDSVQGGPARASARCGQAVSRREPGRTATFSRILLALTHTHSGPVLQEHTPVFNEKSFLKNVLYIHA